jgi:hypothetical protein
MPTKILYTPNHLKFEFLEIINISFIPIKEKTNDIINEIKI